jgi:hypothetical protein
MSDYNKINKEANQILKAEYFIRKIFRCEVKLEGCWNDRQSWHHKHKRNWYKSRPELLSEYSQTIGICNHCHDILEKDSKLTAYYFKKLRGNEMNLSKKKPIKAIKKSSKKADWMRSHKCKHCGNILSGLWCPKCGDLST